MTFSTRSLAQSLDQEFCYSRAEVEQLAEGIVELKKCEAVLVEKQALIEERLAQFKGPQEGKLFWQDPLWFGSGMLASFTLGVIMMYKVK